MAIKQLVFYREEDPTDFIILTDEEVKATFEEWE
jgi:hypothetical protein